MSRYSHFHPEEDYSGEHPWLTKAIARWDARDKDTPETATERQADEENAGLEKENKGDIK